LRAVQAKARFFASVCIESIRYFYIHIAYTFLGDHVYPTAIGHAAAARGTDSSLVLRPVLEQMRKFKPGGQEIFSVVLEVLLGVVAPGDLFGQPVSRVKISRGKMNGRFSKRV
jgi:hypothetical protein